MREHAPLHPHRVILGSDGAYVGAFVAVRGDALLVAPRDARETEPLRLPLDIVASLDTVIRLTVPAREVIARWLTPEATPA